MLNESIGFGIGYHLLGAIAAASFYVPLKFVKGWLWEAAWITNGFASWIVMPLLVAFALLPDAGSFYRQFDTALLLKTYLLGALWGIGGLTFGMTMRYLGLSIGYGVAIGVTLIVGTLAPPILNGELHSLMTAHRGALFGIAIAVLGIILTSAAGFAKEQSRGIASKEFDLKKGIVIALTCGILSASMALAIDAAKPMQEAALRAGVDPLFQLMPSYVIIMQGGFATNAVWCIYRMVRRWRHREDVVGKANNGRNTVLALFAGVIWYLQFFFYGWGHVRMVAADMGFVSWTLHMSLLVLGGGLAGLAMREWKNCRGRIIALQAGGIASLVMSTVVIGFFSGGG